MTEHRHSPEAEARISKTRTQQSKTGPSRGEPGAPPRQQDTAEGDVQRVEHELKKQTEERKQHVKPEVNADRPRDAKLKPERKGVI